ncbi:hypothetical protein CDAR_244791 [Caerostris darwini]|uniref:Uncharacterized protein n=1 Tax=Caerostris darwini TaxID=1538125 RepID=A0AAV4MND6_9ARAC|nr:hypothetical protein CDAR_244791 [Caerostris darwini]
MVLITRFYEEILKSPAIQKPRNVCEQKFSLLLAKLGNKNFRAKLPRKSFRNNFLSPYRHLDETCANFSSTNSARETSRRANFHQDSESGGMTGRAFPTAKK